MRPFSCHVFREIGCREGHSFLARGNELKFKHVHSDLL